MAIFHLSVKTISRSAGRSATAAAAYRAGVKITDRRSAEVFDYRRRGGVESAELFLPLDAPEWAHDRNELWNAAEQSETRKNSTVAREFEVALPAELTLSERQALAHDFTQALVRKYGFAADCAIHFPHQKENQSKRKDAAIESGDSRNHHAHILCSTRKLTAEGFTVKTRELDDRTTGADQVVECRALFAEMTNAALAKAGQSARVDHRRLVAQGIDDRDAGIHLGPIATAIERRGEVSEKTKNYQARQAEADTKVAALVAIAQAQARAEQEAASLAAAQARQLAIRTELTARREIENDRVRDEAFANIDGHVTAAVSASAATGRALKFTQSDHAIIGENLAAASGHLGRAVENARGRQHHRHAGAIAQALGRRLEQLVPALVAIARQIEHHLVELVAKARRAQAQRQLDQDKAALDLPGNLAAAKVERDRPPMWDAGPDPRTYYHPDKVAARQAAQPEPAPQEIRAAAAGVADLRMPLQRSRQKVVQKADQAERMSAAKLAADTKRSTPEAPATSILQEASALLEAAIAKKAQWDASLQAERALYLTELTQQAHAKTVAGVAEHQAHLDAKPRLFGRDKWYEQRLSFEKRDTANNREWQILREGHYPIVERDKEAVQQAVQQRVSAKNPVLAREMPQVNATLQAERARVDALERESQAQERAERAKAQALDEALSAFKGHALKREMKALGYGDTGAQWNAIPELLRDAIEDFNRLPLEARPVALARMREDMQRDPQVAKTLRQGLPPVQGNGQGTSR